MKFLLISIDVAMAFVIMYENDFFYDKKYTLKYVSI